MFTWYKNAKICIVFLEDVHSSSDFETSFKRSVWWTRSWTLQELLAPKLVDFFDANWTFIGSKESKSSLIEEITGIASRKLSNEHALRLCSVGEKLSWAAYREATRPEDVAYSLMGLFDVNMPLLYG